MPLSTLCLACGLCCDGNLFTSVPLRPSEVPVLERLGLPVMVREDGRPGFAQRCTALEGKCCQVYSQRPEACRSYRCHLLTALAEGELSLKEALGVVAEAHERIRAVEALLPPAREDSPSAVLQRARVEPLAAEAREAWEQAEGFLDRHFRGRHRRGK